MFLSEDSDADSLDADARGIFGGEKPEGIFSDVDDTSEHFAETQRFLRRYKTESREAVKHFLQAYRYTSDLLEDDGLEQVNSAYVKKYADKEELETALVDFLKTYKKLPEEKVKGFLRSFANSYYLGFVEDSGTVLYNEPRSFFERLKQSWATFKYRFSTKKKEENENYDSSFEAIKHIEFLRGLRAADPQDIIIEEALSFFCYYCHDLEKREAVRVDFLKNEMPGIAQQLEQAVRRCEERVIPKTNAHDIA